jgi:hypothetical protein
MNRYLFVTLLLIYYIFAIAIKRYYYKRITCNLDGVYQYCLVQTMLVGLLIIINIFSSDDFLTFFYHPVIALTILPFFMVFVNSIYEIICLKNRFKKTVLIFIINIYLYIFYVMLVAMFTSSK